MIDRDRDDESLTQPASTSPGRDTKENVETDAKVLGESAGGFTGMATGMAFGAMAGPIGLLVGGIAGAVGGWWAGHAIADALTDDDDVVYRSRYETSPSRLGDRAYEDVRPAYQLGHLAGRNPDYAGRSFDQIEPDLQRAWNDIARSRHGEWTTMRGYAREAFSRARSRFAGTQKTQPSEPRQDGRTDPRPDE